MQSYRSSLSASPELKSIRLPAGGAVQLLTTLLVFSLCLFPNLATAQSPHIYDVPQVGPPTSQAQVVGNGWDPNATIDLYFDSTDVGLVDTDNNGSFGMALRAPTIRQNGFLIQIPKDAVPGQHWITAVERITELQAQVPFTVQTDWAQFNFEPQHRGLNPYENVLSPATVGSLVLKWSYQTGGFRRGPAVANGVVYVGSGDSNLYALNAGTGAFLWKYQTEGNITSVPAVANGVVYTGSVDRNLYALNASTGALLWKYPTEYYVGSSPSVANGVVYFGNSDYGTSYIYALNANTGKFMWKYPTDGQAYSSPSVADGVVYTASNNGHVYALNASTGDLLWQQEVGQQIQGSQAVANGLVYVGSSDNNVYALDASSGAVVWKYTAGGVVVSSLAVAYGAVYFGSVDGNLYALTATTGTVLWKYPTGEIDYGSPAVANGVVYIPTENNGLYALNASTGALLWKYTTGGEDNSEPAVVNGVVYLASGYGKLYAFGLPSSLSPDKLNPPERPDPSSLLPNWNLQPNPVVTPAKK